MSRIGKLPVPVPSGVEVTIDGSVVSIKGPKGTLQHTVAAPITVSRAEDGQIVASGPEVAREADAVARNSLQNFWKGQGWLRALSNPIPLTT